MRKPGMISRLSGHRGCYNTEKLISDTFRQAGLQTDTQQFSVVVPVTEYCELLDDVVAPVARR